MAKNNNNAGSNGQAGDGDKGNNAQKGNATSELNKGTEDGTPGQDGEAGADGKAGIDGAGGNKEGETGNSGQPSVESAGAISGTEVQEKEAPPEANKGKKEVVPKVEEKGLKIKLVVDAVNKHNDYHSHVICSDAEGSTQTIVLSNKIAETFEPGQSLLITITQVE